MRPAPLLRTALALSLSLLPTTCGDSSGAATTTSSATTDTSTSTSTGPVDPTTSATTTSAASTTPDPTTSGTTAETTVELDDSTTATTTTSTTSTDTTDTGSSTDTGTSGQELRVLQLNLCHSGVAGCYKGDAVLAKAVEVIDSVAPTLVTVNESCRADLPWLAEQTGALDHRFTPALRADDTPVKCKNGDDYGNGLLAWSAPTWDAAKHGVYAAQSSMTERRVWLCMGYTGFVGCTTHLSTAGATALEQCHAFVDGPLTTHAADGPAIMGGDWNLKYKGDPDAQDCVSRPFYRKGDGSVQHIIATDDLAFLETIVIDMDGTTDHPGLAVRLVYP